MAGEAVAQITASIAVMQQLNIAMAADAEAAKVAAQSGATLAQAKGAIAAASKQASDAIKAETKANQDAAKAAEQTAAKQKKSAEDAANAAKEAANAQKQSAKEWQDSGDLMTSPIDMVKKALNGMGPEGQAAAMGLALATAGVTALSGAIIGGMTTAIGVVEKMAERLSMFSALGGSAAAGKATLDMVSKLSERLPFSTDQLAKWAQSMQRAGVQGKGLESAVKAIAAAAALNPEGGAAAAEAALAALSGGAKESAAFMKSLNEGSRKAEGKLREMGLTVADLGGKTAVAKMKAGEMAKAIEAALARKGAGRLDQMGSTFEVIAMKAKEGLGSIFSGLGKSVEPFMASVKSMFAMFNKGGPMVAILKPIVTSVFGTLFSWATRAVNFVHGAFQQIVIAGLKVRIAIQPIVVAFRMLSAEVGKAITASGLFSGKSSALATVLGFVKTVLVNTFLTAVTAVTGFIRILAAMAGFAGSVIAKVRGIFKNLSLPSLAGAAGTMISSFIAGIMGKLGAVVASMASMGAAAKKGLLGALGIASPSKVALEAAGNVTGSFADKVDDGKGAVQKSFDGMVKAPGPSKSSGGASKGSSADLSGILERLCNVLEASPGVREVVAIALDEAAREGGL